MAILIIETEWIAARQWRQQCGDQCLGKMLLPLLPEPLMSPLQVEQNSTDRTTLCISLICGPRRQLCRQQLTLDAGGLWPECLDM